MALNIRIESTSKQVMQGELFALLIYFDTPAIGEPVSALAIRFAYPEEAFEIVSVASHADALFPTPAPVGDEAVPHAATTDYADGLFWHVAERAQEGGIMLTSGLYMAITCRMLNESYRGAIITPGTCNVAFAGESRLGTVTAPTLNVGHTITSLRQEIGQELGEMVTGAVSGSWPGSPNSFISNDLIDDMESLERHVGSWAWMQTAEGAATYQERRINACDPTRGMVSFSRVWTGSRVANMAYEIHDMLPPSEINRLIASAAKSLAYQVTLRLPYTEGVTRYSLAAYPWIETPEQAQGLMIGPSWDSTNAAQTPVPWWRVSMEGGTIYLDISSSSLPGGDTLYLALWRLDASATSDLVGFPDTAAFSASINRRWLVSNCLWRVYEYLTRNGPAQDTARYQRQMTAEGQRFNALSKRFTPRIKAVVRLPNGFNGWRSISGSDSADADLGFITGGAVLTVPTTDFDAGDLDIPIKGDAPDGGSTEDTTMIVTELIVNGASILNGNVNITPAETVTINFTNGLAKMTFKDQSGAEVLQINALGGLVVSGAAVFNGTARFEDFVTFNSSLFATEIYVGPSNLAYGLEVNTPAHMAYGALVENGLVAQGSLRVDLDDAAGGSEVGVYDSEQVRVGGVNSDGEADFASLSAGIHLDIAANGAVVYADPAAPLSGARFFISELGVPSVILDTGVVYTLDMTAVE